ncbi:MAG: adenylyl-sulfate kinase, partial [Anaerolineaceae bacterium]|nr:adenylyl-sulfate kinase [Anaerolineaceae bacterium]
LETCMDRDPKKFYKKAKNGEIKNYTGITSTYEVPECPDLVLDTELESVEQCVEKLVHLAYQLGVIKED